MVNWCKAHSGNTAATTNNQILGAVITQLRNNGVSAAALGVAENLLRAEVSPGKPISGRAVAHVLDMTIQWASEEQAQSANLDINISGLCNKLSESLDDVFAQKHNIFGMPNAVPTMEERAAIMETVRGNCRQFGERHQMHAPDLNKANEILNEACRRHALDKLHGAISQAVHNVATHDTPEAPLCQRLRAAMTARGMDVAFQPQDLAALHEGIAKKLDAQCTIANAHPPLAGEAEAIADRFVERFLDCISIVDNHATLTQEQKTITRAILVSWPDPMTQGMTTAVCDALANCAGAYADIAAHGLTDEGLEAIHTAMSTALEQPGGAAGRPLLRPGIAGIDEANTVRGMITQAGIALANVADGQDSKAVVDRLTAPRTPLTALRFAAAHSDGTDRNLQLKNFIGNDILRTFVGKGNLDTGEAMLALQEPGVGQLSMTQLREILGPNVHGVDLEEDTHMNLQALGQSFMQALRSDLAVEAKGIESAGFSPDMNEVANKFRYNFLMDFFRNGMEVNGQRYGQCGTQDHAAMETQLAALVALFPDADTAAAVCQELHQAAGACLQLSLRDDPSLASYFATMMTSMGKLTVDDLFISLNFNEDGNYHAKYESHSQRANITPYTDDVEFELTEPVGLNMLAEVRISSPLNDMQMELTHFDIVTSRTPLETRKLADMPH